MADQELGYDPADQGLDQKDLEDKYGDAGHPIYTLDKYREELSKNPAIEEHFNGYYDWVSFKCISDHMGVNGADDIQAIETVDQFAQVAGQWHAGMLERLKNLRAIPFGTGVEYETATGESGMVTLKGDGMKGFQAALTAAIAELERWPFVVSTVEAPAQEASDGTAPGN